MYNNKSDPVHELRTPVDDNAGGYGDESGREKILQMPSTSATKDWPNSSACWLNSRIAVILLTCRFKYTNRSGSGGGDTDLIVI